MEDSRDHLDRMEQRVRQFERMLLVDTADCRRSEDMLEKRLSKLEGVCGRLDGVSNSIHKFRDGMAHYGGPIKQWFYSSIKANLWILFCSTLN